MPPRRLPVSVTRYEYLEGEAYDTDIYYTSVDTESPYLANTFTYRINSMSFNALFDQNGSPIVYPPVKETLPDGSYTLYRYSSFAQYSDSLPEIYTPYAAGMMHEPPSYSSRTYLPRTSYAWQRGLLLEQSLYSADGDPAGLPTNHRSEAASTTFLRNQWSAHGLPADGRSQRSAESVQRTEQNRIGHRQKLRSVIPTHSTLTVPKRLPLPSANNPYLHGSLSRPKSFRSAEPEGVIIAP